MSCNNLNNRKDVNWGSATIPTTTASRSMMPKNDRIYLRLLGAVNILTTYSNAKKITAM